MPLFSTHKDKPTTKASPVIQADTWLAFFIMLMIVSFLSPFHSVVIGYDLFAGLFRYILISFGLIGFLLLTELKKMTISTLTWWLLAFLIFCHILFMSVSYPDGMIFDIGALFCVSLLGVATSNIINKPKFLNIIFGGAYIMALGSLSIQIMQIFEFQWIVGHTQLTHLAGNNRLFANMLQPNHLAYVSMLALCGVVYHFSIFNEDKTKKYFLILLFCLIVVSLALTKSRAGFVMGLAVFFVFCFSHIGLLKSKLSMFFKYTIGFIGIYVLTSGLIGLMDSFNQGGSLGAIGRLTESGNRLSLAYQALIMFADNPIIGVGYSNYKIASFDYLESFKFLENVHHSHNFLTMLLAEMGILGFLCLLPVFIMLFGCMHTKHSTHSAIALSFVVVTIIYANLEFPFWYFSYLALFVIFLGLVDQKYMDIPKFRFSYLIKNINILILFLSIIVSEYYIWQFSKNNYIDGNRYVNLDLHPIEEEKVSNDTAIFGLKIYNDMILASQTSINSNNIEDKKIIFKNAANYFGTSYYLSAYAQVLAYDNQPELSLKYFKIGCLRSLDLKSSCNEMQYNLQELSKKHPEYFMGIYNQYKIWRMDNSWGIDSGE